ncbi:TM2 domain-containing protein 1 isoform X2 [Phyllopteryx taeniolatus]|uniref:TM2 domain-containing protein 1 isoform X2 n=1 Tax=Phyllopteryx taeniolatus TaxID=161469 RepID=UPI002AD21F40|nr:TM2 domain-containing protein 1 isoform X2 [Phyllopteryx taeniolatus]
MSQLVRLRCCSWTILLFFLCRRRLWAAAAAEAEDSCDNLRLGQYLCKEPKIDDGTQEPENCRDASAWVECLPAPNVTCRLSNGTEFRFSGEEVGFNRTVPCRNVSVYSYKVAVALSLFLGWLGADRFYLGYPALGVLKFCTVGFCGIGTLVDFILIAVQMVGPSDGSDYIVDYYGARLSRLTVTERTYRKPHLSP